MTSLTPAGQVLAAEIARTGPIQFSRFMEVALYHPEFGYYRRRPDPFGASGDFYTAEQLQPVFGRLIVRYLQMLWPQPAPQTLVELGAGRAEMAEAFRSFRYLPMDIGFGEMPQRFSGIVFSNEFFDAIPVDVIAMRNGRAVERLVNFDGDKFVWFEGPAAPDELENFEEGTVIEVQTHRLRWLDRIDRSLESGLIITMDYGYTRRERIRFPHGTLMSYRRHHASSDVLAGPGERDITAHVSFTELEEHGEHLGWRTVAFETLTRALMRAGEKDEFSEALSAGNDTERRKHRLQLKSLLVGMGETFRVLVQQK